MHSEPGTRQEGLTVNMSAEQVQSETNRIATFLAEHLGNSTKAAVPVSGGLDSDVVARLTVRAVGTARTKLFVVLQQDMEERHLRNARRLAHELGICLVEIDLASIPRAFIQALHEADPVEDFRPDGLLDPSRAKCSVRTVLFSTYQDRGYVIIGTSNRTEYETGFFLPFGDAVAHLKPIMHLYKSQVRQIACLLGTAKDVLDQPASAGFWPGEEDLEDLAYWLYNEAPIAKERRFDAAAKAEVARMREALTTEKLDIALLAIAKGMTTDLVEMYSGLPTAVAGRLIKLVSAAHVFKHRPLGVRLDNWS
jgi:NAD+ synthase